MTTVEVITAHYDSIRISPDNPLHECLVDDATVFGGIPFVHGSSYGFAGQLAVFDPTGPADVCLYPGIPDSVPSVEPIGIIPPSLA